MQAAALGSSIGTAVGGGLITGQHKSKHFPVPPIPHARHITDY